MKPELAKDGLRGLYTIPAEAPFADSLAQGLLQHFAGDPLALARARIYLPTRRSCRSLQEAFLRAAAGRALLLPRMTPLGDLGEEEEGPPATGFAAGPVAAALPPALPGLKRQLMLMRLVQGWAGAAQAAGAPQVIGQEQAFLLAGELGRLIDQVETEGLSFDQLASLVPDDYAAHWQLTLAFLEIVTHAWPKIEADLGLIGAAARRRQLAELQAESWQREPPGDPVIIAGSTGTVPATAKLIAAALTLPQGLVVLPGLERDSAADFWSEVRRDPVHPQHALARLLQRLGREAGEVALWPWLPSGAAAPRGRFIAMALAPAESSDAWGRYLDGVVRDELADALAGVTRIDCATAGEEALVAALWMRHELESPGRTAALVTPDRDLARRVAAELRRWGVETDDSAGLPLSDTPPGAYLRLLVGAAEANWAPVELLALLKHPLAAGGMEPAAFRTRVRQLERAALRGPRPASGLAGAGAALSAAVDAGDAAADLPDWWADLAGRLQGLSAFHDRPRIPLAELVEVLVQAGEALADDGQGSGAGRLWSGDAGEVLANLLAELMEASEAVPEIEIGGAEAFLTSVLSGQVVRPRYGRHPRLAILGPLEARLQRFDLMILGGLNEGTWPAPVDPGPWLSRPMMARFGLPQPERRIGQAAHDFVQGCGADRVLLTRALRVEGAPTVPSRWLLRLEALAEGCNLKDAFATGGDDALDWTRRLDSPPALQPVQPPRPCPPVAARPRKLSVTRIETWMRDPYGLYAEKILGLKALDPLDADPSLADRGNLIHKAMERFVKRYPEALPANPEAALVEIGGEVFAPLRAYPGLWAFWWPRFLRLADWFAAQEAARRGDIRHSHAEVQGELSFAAPGGDFTLTAAADRIDQLTDGSLAILDYKTGQPPAAADLAEGLAPQLPLEAAIAAAGGFAGIGPSAVSQLAFWQLSGGAPAGKAKPVKGDPADLGRDALAGLVTLVSAFDDPATPYLSRPRPGAAPRYSDYAHLARVKEWASGSGEAE